jgi:hypothetical protein
VARTQDVWGAEGISGRVKFLLLAWAGMPKTTLLRPKSKVRLTRLNKDFAELPAITSSSQEVQKNIADVIREFQNVNFSELFSELFDQGTVKISLQLGVFIKHITDISSTHLKLCQCQIGIGNRLLNIFQ